MKEISIQIPQELIHPLFFQENDSITFLEESLSVFDGKKIFLYDAAHYLGLDCLKPWKNRGETIPVLIKESKELEVTLQSCFQKRDTRSAAPLLKQVIGLFIEMLHWANGMPVRLNPSIAYDSLPIQPINGKERLEFIFIRPYTYPSFVQLFELIAEMEKVFQKSLAMEKVRKKED